MSTFYRASTNTETLPIIIATLNIICISRGSGSLWCWNVWWSGKIPKKWVIAFSKKCLLSQVSELPNGHSWVTGFWFLLFLLTSLNFFSSLCKFTSKEHVMCIVWVVQWGGTTWTDKSQMFLYSEFRQCLICIKSTLKKGLDAHRKEQTSSHT